MKHVHVFVKNVFLQNRIVQNALLVDKIHQIAVVFQELGMMDVNVTLVDIDV